MAGTVLTLTEADDGRTVEVRVGQSLRLRLRESAATGYRWHLEPVDTGLLDVQEDEYSRPSTAVGGGGAARWILTAKAAGVAEITLKRWRHWEGEPSVRQRFAVTLRISP